MHSSSSAAVRRAEPCDADAIAALGDLAHLEEVFVVLRGDEVVVGAGAVDPHGPPAEPEHPLLVIRLARTATEEERRALARRLIEHARDALRAARLLTQVDPMQYDAMCVYESFGFRPTGRGPYHDLGGGAVRYVNGYESAEGSLLDLAVEIACGAEDGAS